MGKSLEVLFQKAIEDYVKQEAGKAMEKAKVELETELNRIVYDMVPRIVRGVQVVAREESLDGKYTIQINVAADGGW